jgi:hypothetical protein
VRTRENVAYRTEETREKKIQNTLSSILVGNERSETFSNRLGGRGSGEDGQSVGSSAQLLLVTGATVERKRTRGQLGGLQGKRGYERGDERHGALGRLLGGLEVKSGLAVALRGVLHPGLVETLGLAEVGARLLGQVVGSEVVLVEESTPGSLGEAEQGRGPAVGERGVGDRGERSGEDLKTIGSTALGKDKGKKGRG